MSLTELSLDGNYLFPSRESLVSDIPAVDGKFVNLFLKCTAGVPRNLSGAQVFLGTRI